MTSYFSQHLHFFAAAVEISVERECFREEASLSLHLAERLKLINWMNVWTQAEDTPFCTDWS